MQFFRAMSGMLFPISQISSIGSVQEASSPTSLPFHNVRLDGQGFEDFGIKVSKFEIERVLESSAPVVTAEPGTQLATFHAFSNTGPEGWYATLTPIVAWRIVEGQPLPITIEDDWCRNKNHTAVRMPNGFLVDPSGERWPNLKGFEDSARAWVIADREEQAKDSEAPAADA